MTTNEEDRKIEEATAALVAIYIVSLSKAALEVHISGAYYALKELNVARGKAGLSPVPIDLKQITIDAIKASEEYRNMLEVRGGSMVVEVIGNTEKLVFKPWLTALSEATQKQIKEVMDKSFTESWTSQVIRKELNHLLEGKKNSRARNAAFTEMRTQQHAARIKAWKSGGLGYVQRHAVGGANTCTACLVMNERIYRIDLAPELSHIGCLCWYSPYITKPGWSPDEDIQNNLNDVG